MCRDKSFVGALICTDDGLIVTSYTSQQALGIVEENHQEGFDQVVSALGSLFLSVASRARKELKLKHVEELYLRGTQETGHLRVIFRVFDTILYGKLVLSILMDQTVPYRRVTTRVIRKIQGTIDTDKLISTSSKK